jgi:2-polyprenyl-3-methyl-5-hydroxy-6-metoxy-1,4-benzoquinol methylase
MSELEPNARCKICNDADLTIFAHTAKCGNCGVLLYYPYPQSDTELVESGEGKAWDKADALYWYAESAFLNHNNFTHMLRFAMSDSDRRTRWDILDYGGGGGQFALVCKSHFPDSQVHIADIADEALLDQWRPMNIQIPFREFATDDRKFDFIFMNDVFEHVSDPVAVLGQLAGKLKEDGRIFVDTPKQFWLYPITKAVSRKIYTKVLRGTVSRSHLQIWSKKSFNLTVHKAGLRVEKYKECDEFTMPPDFYLKNMGITNGFLKMIGRLFYRTAKLFVSNKIMATLRR